MINKDTANAIFKRNACLVVDQDVIPEDIAVGITSKEAVEFAKNMGNGHNGYGIGEDGTMYYLTKRDFFLALTYQNVKWSLKSEEESECED